MGKTKIWKRIIVGFLLVTVFTATALFTACGKNEPNTSSDESNSESHGQSGGGESSGSGDTSGEIDVVDGEYFIYKGKSDYKIVISENPKQEETVAAREFAYFFNEATNVSLEIENDSKSFSADDRVFSIGETKILKSRGVTVNKEELNTQGFIIKTVGNNVILCGGGEYGTLWAVYSMLTELFNYDCLSSDEIIIDRNVTELAKYNFDVKGIPSINERYSSTPHTNVDVTTAHRMRYINRETEAFIQLGSIHDSFQILPPEIYNDKNITANYHPEWYSSDGLQLCYTAGGNETSLSLMIDTALENIKPYILENPGKNNFMFGQEDHNVWCKCSTCSKSRTDYGADSAVVIKFMNRFSERLNSWLDTVSPGRRVNVYFFAYGKTTEPPVKHEGDSYRPVDQSVVLGKNVGVYYAPISVKFTKSFDDPLNTAYKEYLKAWGALADNVTLYLYQTNFRNYLVPYNTFNSLQPIYDFCASIGCKGLYDQGQMDNQVCTGFTYLRDYLASKVLWNTKCDVAAYTDKFFENFYRTAEEPMRKYYDELRSLFVFNENLQNMGGGIYDPILKEEFWPRNTLVRWLGYINQAYEAIKIYETANPTLYETLKTRICVESIAIRYIYLELYGKDDTPDNYEMKRSFKEDALKCNVLKTEEGVEIIELFQKWGV